MNSISVFREHSPYASNQMARYKNEREVDVNVTESELLPLSRNRPIN